MSQVASIVDCPETLEEAREVMKELHALHRQAIGVQDRMEKEIEALQEDKARLDWLEANSADVYEIHGVWYVYPDRGQTAPGIRAAIDALKT